MTRTPEPDISRSDHDGPPNADRVAAFTATYVEHHRTVLRFVQRYLPEADAETVTHDVFLAHWLNPDRWNEQRGTLRAFLIMSAKSRAIDLWRSDTSRQRREARPDPTIPLRVEIDFDGTGDELRHAVEALPHLQRTAIETVFTGNRTYREAATHLGWPEGTLKNRIRLALVRLRVHLADTRNDPATPAARLTA